MKILITGGAGHIGSFLIKRLCNLSIIKKIYVIDAYKEENFYSLFNLNSRKILKIYQDILDIDFKDFSKVDIVIHLAATTNAATSFENKKLIFNNFLITKKIVHYCNSTKATLIFPSSTSVYGSNNNIVYEDDSKYLKPQSPYADVKIIEENYIKNNCKKFKYLIFRLGTIYGNSPGIRFHTAINKFCLQLFFNKEITIWKKNFNFVRPYLYLGDFSKILCDIIKGKKINYNQIYNLVSDNIKLKDIVLYLKKIKKNLKIKFVNTKLINQYSYYVSNNKIVNLKFNFRGNIRKEIKKTIKLLD
jgi:nucleoside-diphosphate-sugar epimerase